MQTINGYLVRKLEFRTVKNDYRTAVTPQEGFYYRDLDSGRIYVWDTTTDEFRVSSFFQTYKYTNYQGEDRIDSNQIYLAKPGQRILGVINGIDEDSCELTKNLNNTSELTFTVERRLDGGLPHASRTDGEITQFYELIQRHYELYIPHHGWFKINEEPEVENDGNVETKSVRAESLEIELQQYDLVDFDINSGEVWSAEMLATDNTYDNMGYKMFRDQVLFYRDTSALEAAIKEFSDTDGSVEALKEFITEKGRNYGCWRITLDSNGEWQINTKIDPDDPESEDYTGTEILETELDRQHELSLLWLILHEHGWEVGFVDPYVDLESDVEDDKIPLANKVGFFQVDSQDIYSFLTQDVAQYFRCIFIFDTENYIVNVYNINNIGYDTNIFLSFQNVQNEVVRSSDTELHTVFHVQGGDELDFTEANFGENQIEDISYFLNTDHFSQEFIDKYNAWNALRDEKRQEYIQLSIDYRNQNDTINEIKYRVPSDAADGSQYATMTEEELINEKANARAMRYEYEHGELYIKRDEHGDPILDGEGHTIFDIDLIRESVDWPIYSSLVDIVLSYPDNESDEAIDHIEFKQGEHSDEYEYDFEASYKQQYPEARLGQIDIALLNRRIIDGYYVQDGMTDEEKAKRTNVKNQKEFLDNYQFDFEHFGYLYGLEELKNYEQTYYGVVSALESTGYNESDGTTYDEETYAKYQKYSTALAQVQAEIAVRQQEYDDATAALDQIVSQMDQIKSDVDMITWEGENGEKFTEEELNLLDKYYIHTDYVNQDIITTSISTNEEIVQTEYQLYLDAMDALYVESHPQYDWETTQDNLLLMPEFHDWHGDLHVGNFVRISFRDDYQVKLRISAITLNPLMLEPTIKLEFTTMTQYKAKRNDFASIIDSANKSTKNAISQTISRKSGTDNTINVDAALILKLLNSSTFQGYIGSNNANITGTTINAVSGSIETIATSVISAMDINVNRITGTQAQFDDLFTNYLKSNVIITKTLQATDAEIGQLASKVITTDELTAKLANIDVADIETLYAGNAFVSSLQTLTSTTAQATINDAYIYNAVAGKITVGDLAAGDITLTDQMRILSDNGQMVMTGTSLQIMGEDSGGNPYVGIQLGYDTNENPSLILRNEDGATILTPSGITSDAVADGLIVNNMISNGTIQKAKLGFNVIEPNAQGGIDITQVYDGSGNLWGVQYTSFKQGTEQALSDLNDEIEASSYQLYINAPRGKNLRGGNIVLNAVLYKNSVDVTSQFAASCFTWTRHSLDSYADEYWNESHLTGSKSITITSNDVNIEADFRCCFEYNGVTVTSSNNGGE